MTVIRVVSLVDSAGLRRRWYRSPLIHRAVLVASVPDSTTVQAAVAAGTIAATAIGLGVVPIDDIVAVVVAVAAAERQIGKRRRHAVAVAVASRHHWFRILARQ